MRKLKPIVAATPEELAGALGLSAVAGRVAGSTRASQASEANRSPAKDHPRGDRQAGRHCANQGDCRSERRSRTRID